MVWLASLPSGVSLPAYYDIEYRLAKLVGKCNIAYWSDWPSDVTQNTDCDTEYQTTIGMIWYNILWYITRLHGI